jgi:hypothetical protein
MELALMFLFICLIVGLVVLSRLNIDFKSNKIMLVGAVLTVSMILLQFGNSIGLAVMAIISMILFFYILYSG